MNDPKYKQLREQALNIARKAMAETLVQGGDESTHDISASNIDHFTNYGIIVAETADAIMQAFYTFHKEAVERAVREARIDELHKVLDTRSETRSEILALPLKRRLRQLQTIRIAAELEKKL